MSDNQNNTKRRSKKAIKFKLQLNDEQKTSSGIVLESAVSAIVGKAGSGKTLLACQIGLSELLKGNVNRLLIMRPAVTAGENLGFLPGDMKDKMDPYLEPIYENMAILHDKADIDKKMESGEIDIMVLGYSRGRTLHNELLIVDEAQNMNMEQLKLVLGRLGKGSKIIFTGDVDQTDIRQDKINPLNALFHMSGGIEGISYIELKQNHRHPLVPAMLEFCSKF